MLLIATAIIISLVLLITLLLFASVLRRLLNERKYRKLDRLRKELGEAVRRALASGETDGLPHPKPTSLPWQALESVLLDLVQDNGSHAVVVGMLNRIGFVSYHESRLTKKSRIIRASSIDTLGKMRSVSSVPKLVPLLNGSDSEILTVTVRALSRIGSQDALSAVVERLPVLLGNGLVTRKAMEASLLNFGSPAIPHLIRYCRESVTDHWVVSCVLESLSHLPHDLASAQFASGLLANPHPEVRSKALKVLSASGRLLPGDAAPLILPLLDDPVWFVRIQAVRTVEGLGLLPAASSRLRILLLDANWNVRDQAAVALSRFPGALDIFLDVLLGTDLYAKESTCEQIEKTGFYDKLFKNLVGDDRSAADKSRQLLATMYQLNFATPLREYLVTGEDDRIRRELGRVVTAGEA